MLAFAAEKNARVASQLMKDVYKRQVLEAAGAEETFRLAWECARPNAVVTIVALYNGSQILPLPEMYGKNLTFKTGGVDGCDCGEILELISPVSYTHLDVYKRQIQAPAHAAQFINTLFK